MTLYDPPRPPAPAGPSFAAAAGAEVQPDAEALLKRVIEIVGNAKSMPLSASVLVSKEELLELLEDAVERLPEDLRRARAVLREREDLLARTGREAEDILEAARVRAERMVQRTEIVREARRMANHTVEEAREEARRLRREAEDYCDRKLAAFEIVLERTTRSVQAGREKLQMTPPPLEPREHPETSASAADAFFDQDR